MPTQQRPPAVGVASPLVLNLPPGVQGDNIHPTRRSVSTVPGVRPWANKEIFRTGLPLLAGDQEPPARARTKVASLEQQSSSKAGECPFSLKIDNISKVLYDNI